MEPAGKMNLKMQDAVIHVDFQNDFVNGSLRALDGSIALRKANIVADRFYIRMLHQVFSRDWHPKGHSSFQEWGKHCVQNSWGAEIALTLVSGLDPVSDRIVSVREPNPCIISKGFNLSTHPYSAFGGIELATQQPLDSILQFWKIERVFITGLVTEWCVKATVLDALRLKYRVVVVEDAIGCLTLGGADAAKKEMTAAGAVFCLAEDI